MKITTQSEPRFTLHLSKREAVVVEHALYLAANSTTKAAKPIKDDADALQGAINDEFWDQGMADQLLNSSTGLPTSPDNDSDEPEL